MRHIRVSTSSDPQMRSMRAPPRSSARITASAGNRDGRRLSASMATMSGVLWPAPGAVRAFGAAPPARSASTRSSAKGPRALAARSQARVAEQRRAHHRRGGAGARDELLGVVDGADAAVDEHRHLGQRGGQRGDDRKIVVARPLLTRALCLRVVSEHAVGRPPPRVL